MRFLNKGVESLPGNIIHTPMGYRIRWGGVQNIRAQKKAPLEHVWYKTMFPAAVFFMRTTILLNLSDLGFYRPLHFQL